uniref:Uncharacterized protein n=1 Tax=Oncorhynchus tshawytscha TaxID=74940 RepID=A0AAZ3QZU6_ONCTS
MSVLGVYLLLFALFYRDGMRLTASSFSAARQMAQRDDGDIVDSIVKGAADHQVVQQIQHQDQTASVYSSGSEFPLKVQVNDMSTRHALSLATVEVYVNYTRTNSALTTEDGRVFLYVPYQLGLPLTIVASMDSYLLTLLPWKTTRIPSAWMNRGLGIMKMEEGKLFWTFMAPHLGYWIAAPMPSIKGYMGHATPMDFISYHSSLIVAVLGGTLVLLVGVLAVMLCCRREPKTKRIHATNMASLEMDQTTTTHDNQLCEVSSQDSTHSEDVSHQLLTRRGDGKLDDSATSKYNDDFNIYIEGTDLIGPESSRPLQQALLVNSSDILWIRGISEGINLPLSLNESLFLQDRLLHFHNQPVAIRHAPGLWSSPEQPSPGCRSATLPRTGGMYDLGQGQTVGMDNLTQTLPKAPLATLERSQGHGREGTSQGQGGLHGDTSTFKPESWSRYYSSLPESVSVPSTLNEARGRGGHRPGGGRPFSSELQEADQNSEQTPSELTRARPSPLAPRAWFVSLEGKPAAEICRNSSSVTDSKRKRRAAGDSRDTSLDSGVDMSEPNNQPTVGNRQMMLDRSGTFVKRATLHIKPPLLVSGEELNKEYSGKGALGGQTPNDDAPQGTNHGASGTSTNVSQERGEGPSACPERH